MNRLNITLKHAAAYGFDVDPRAVEWAKALLEKEGHKVQAIPAMKCSDVPVIYTNLKEDTPTQLALRLRI